MAFRTWENVARKFPEMTVVTTGPDGIHVVVWKEFAFELSPALADIYNSSLEQGYFPTQLKQAIVVPVPKLPPPKSVKNYVRPISLTSLIAKVLEGFSAESLITNVFNKLDNKLFLVARQLRLLSSLCTLFWKHWTLVAHTSEFSSQTLIKASTLWTTMYC